MSSMKQEISVKGVATIYRKTGASSGGDLIMQDTCGQSSGLCKTKVGTGIAEYHACSLIQIPKSDNLSNKFHVGVLRHKPFAPQYEHEMHVLRNRKVDTRGKGIVVARASWIGICIGKNVES